MLRLPEEHRQLFKEPFGVLYPTIDEVLPLIAGKLIYAVGDVVTHNLHKKGVTPAIAVVDGHTMRSPCKTMPEIHGERITIKNPAGTLTEDLIRALDHAVKNPPATIIVDGEEDLAVIPLVLSAREGAVVLYGQPRKGVVLRLVTPEARTIANSFLSCFVHTES